MNMLTRIAFSNAKYHKTKNILTGIAIFPTTLLIFLVPTIGLDLISAQKAAINRMYPNWHALFRDVSEDTVTKLSSHHLVDTYGLRSDLGCYEDDTVQNSYIYMDQAAFDLYNLELLEGHLPEQENEIVVSKKLLEKLSYTAGLGDTISLSYQVARTDGLDYAKQKDFVISGFLKDSAEDESQDRFTSLISKTFLQNELSEDGITYRFLFKVNPAVAKTSTQAESTIQELAGQFHIEEQRLSINKDYIWANYVDADFLKIIVLIMAIIVLAGVITIYSIYYISVVERVQELGKLKAIGATTGQIKRIILTEGMITICSMAITGLFCIVVATILSCANPEDAATSNILGEYSVTPHIEFGNKEHPEYEWHEIQKANPLTNGLKESILAIDGITSVETFLGTYVTSDVFGDEHNGIMGVPESQKERLENGIIEGQITYEELKSGDKIIIDKNLLYWYPNLALGDCIEVTIDNGDELITKTLEIAAIGEYPLGFTNYNYMIMASEGVQTLSNYSANMYFHIFASEKYNKEVDTKLHSLVEACSILEVGSWKSYYDEWTSSIALTKMSCFAFLGILGAICIMNMINTMISNAHNRKKEFGMLQAIGMSDHQLLVTLALSKTIKKDSIIDRIRFSN